MRGGDVVAGTGGRRVHVAVLGAVLVLVAAALGSTHTAVGDTYCGSAFYDSYRNGACGRRLAVLGTIALLCLGTGVAAMVLAWLAGLGLRGGFRALPTLVLGMVALGLGLVAANRLLEPSRQAYCGSVVNRHRTYEPAIERDCDRILRPNAKTAALAGVGSVLAAGGAVGLRPRRRRRDNPAPLTEVEA